MHPQTQMKRPVLEMKAEAEAARAWRWASSIPDTHGGWSTGEAGDDRRAGPGMSAPPPSCSGRGQQILEEEVFFFFFV